MTKSSTDQQATEQTTFVICVVALDRMKLPKKTYKPFYMAVKGSREQAVLMQNQIAKVGFKAGDERIFPDDIESINLKVKE